MRTLKPSAVTQPGILNLAGDRTRTPRVWRAFVLATLVFLPACAGRSAWTASREQGFEARSPCELDSAAVHGPVPVRADYNGPSSEETRTAETAPGRRRTLQEGPTPLPGQSPTEHIPTTFPPASRAIPASGSSSAMAPEPRVSTYGGDGLMRLSDGSQSSMIRQVSGTSTSRAASRFSPAEPRMAPRSAPAPRLPAEVPYYAAMAEQYPDEYLFDGGDRLLPAHQDGALRMGLDTEDTIAEYADHEGGRHQRPSSRVAVYSPRFGSVRTVSGPDVDTKVVQAFGGHSVNGAGSLNQGNGSDTLLKADATEGLHSRRRADGLIRRNPAIVAEGTNRATVNVKAQTGAEGINTEGGRTLEQALGATLADGIQNAVAWTKDQYPMLAADTSEANAVTAEFRPKEIVGLEDQRRTLGNLRILKMADKSVAQSGDIVRFEIRFENLGDHEVRNIRIMDNLTPRLQYVDGSAQVADGMTGDVIVSPNGEGSSVLTFEIDQPLPGHTAGSLTFETRVQ